MAWLRSGLICLALSGSGCAAAVELGAARTAVGAAARVGVAEAVAARSGLAAARTGLTAAGVSIAVMAGMPAPELASLRGGAVLGLVGRGPSLPVGSARIVSKTGEPLGSVEIRGGRAVVSDTGGNVVAHAYKRGQRILYRSPLGENLGYSRILEEGRINHFAGPGGSYVGYDVIVGDVLRHYDKHHVLIGETLLTSATMRGLAPDAAALLALAAAWSEEDEEAEKNRQYIPYQFTDVPEARPRKEYEPLRRNE